MKPNERGRSMIEMLGVLAIVGILSIGGIIGYSKAMLKYKQDKLMSELSQLIINIRVLYTYQHNYAGISNKLLVDSGAVPAPMIDSATSSGMAIKHAFNGDIKVYPSNGPGGENTAFEIYAEGLNKQACLILATMDWGQDLASGFRSMYIGTENEEITEPKMKEVILPNEDDPDGGIYTIGQHEDSIPIPAYKALNICACPVNECIIGLKYAN